MPNRVVLPRRGPKHFTIYDNFSGKVGNDCRFQNHCGTAIFSTRYIWDDSIFINLLITENDLRMTVQREERLKIQYREFQKALHSDEDIKHLDELEAFLKDLSKKCDELMQKLHLCEMDLFKRPLKKMYDSLRKNRTWYLRKELVDYCAANGGCCSRDCGCCQKRHWTSHRPHGLGHCTVECWCCRMHRGKSPTQEKRAQQTQHLRERLQDKRHSAFLLIMIESYFVKPEWHLRKKPGTKPVEEKKRGAVSRGFLLLYKNILNILKQW